MTLAVFFFFYLDQNTSFPSYSILLAASSIILSRSRTERKPRGSTLGRAVRLVVRRMKIVSRGNATWFAGHRVARAIARHTYVFYYFFSFVSLSFSRPLVERIRRRPGDSFPKTLRYIYIYGSHRANARARARLSRDGRSFCVHATLKNP